MSQTPDPKRLNELAGKYLKGKITPAEQEEFDSWFNQHDTDNREKQPLGFTEEEQRKALFDRIQHQIQPKTKTGQIWPWIAAAASVLLFITIGTYYFLNKAKPTKQLAQNQPFNIKPGGNKAILTLSNGNAISLTDAKNGTVAAQGNTVVKKTGAGLIEYAANPSNGTTGTQPIYNTLTTPRGGRFEGLLPDGTHVILDAASSVKYQVNTTGKDRLVWITGQVHFHVNYNADRPFYVNVKGQTMKDLGTDFNVNAYDDEPVIAVTLEEGSVSVTKQTQSVTLVPGQQATTRAINDKINVRAVNIDDVIAWTKGKISFQNEDIQEIMREVSRWYDVDIKYEGQIPSRQFDGSIARNSKLADLLKVLEFDNIHFTVSGNNITVKP